MTETQEKYITSLLVPSGTDVMADRQELFMYINEELEKAYASGYSEGYSQGYNDSERKI